MTARIRFVLDEELSRSSVRDRAFAACAVRSLGARAEAFCARRQPALRSYAAALFADREQFGVEVTRLDRAVPAGIEQVHASWYEPPARSTSPPAQRWLERRAYGHLVEMSQGPSRAASVLDRLEHESSADLGDLLVALGRRRVATAFSAAPHAALAQLCARLGEPAASELLAHVRALAPALTPDEVQAAQRALFSLGLDSLAPVQASSPAPERGERSERKRGSAEPVARPPPPDEARRLYLRAGASWLGPALAARGGDRLRRVAQRLPRDQGELLEAGARTTLADADQAAAVAATSAILGAARGHRW